MASLASTSAFPSGRHVTAYTVQVTRAVGSNYASSPVAMPAGFTPTAIRILGGAASNAGTSATLSVGSSGYAGADFLAGYDVKTATTGVGQSLPSSALLVGNPLPFDTIPDITYREAGTASTSGGPWAVIIEGFNVG